MSSVFQTHMNYTIASPQMSTPSYPCSESDGRTSPTGSVQTSSDFAPTTPPSRAAERNSAVQKPTGKSSGQQQCGRGDPWKRLRYYSRSSATSTEASMSRSDSGLETAVPQPSFMVRTEAPVPLPSFMMPQPSVTVPSVAAPLAPASSTASHNPLVQWALSSRTPAARA